MPDGIQLWLKKKCILGPLLILHSHVMFMTKAKDGYCTVPFPVGAEDLSPVFSEFLHEIYKQRPWSYTVLDCMSIYI